MADLTVPPGARLLHIGPPKTGTSSLQSTFFQLRGQLETHGVVVAGDGPRPRAAVRELLGRSPRGRVERRRLVAAEGDVAPPPSWAGLVAEVAGHGDRRTFVSNELFATATDEQASRAVADLGGDRVHVVMVARALPPLLPSQWQQRVRKSTQVPSFEDWLGLVLSPDEQGEHHADFWLRHDLAAQIERWSAAASPDRVSVVVAREGDRSRLPRVFEALLGLPDGLLDQVRRPRSNASLGFSQAELIRWVDEEARKRGWGVPFNAGVLRPAVYRSFNDWPPGSDQPVELPAWAAARIDELTEQRIACLEKTEARVIGSPEDLRAPVSTTSSARRPAEATVPVAAAGATVAWAVEQTLEDAARQRRRAVKKARAAARRRAASAARRRPALDDASGRELVRALAGRTAARLRVRGR